eukprot:CAMPEP_0113572660 /NCGR_PEP_ID=MMETSP0015_2-20120614/26208_1 /TAXON_ID=2838 /ORGANISM="Odontella" /LENGTH=253 /DNA_ID=CAMNT_0000475697 /DNA_START=295 /DNA_END=1056 /DNA_ORIENTATION=- /assembly_acc=CAM_ASM_000160
MASHAALNHLPEHLRVRLSPYARMSPSSSYTGGPATACGIGMRPRLWSGMGAGAFRSAAAPFRLAKRPSSRWDDDDDYDLSDSDDEGSAAPLHPRVRRHNNKRPAAAVEWDDDNDGDSDESEDEGILPRALPPLPNEKSNKGKRRRRTTTTGGVVSPCPSPSPPHPSSTIDDDDDDDGRHRDGLGKLRRRAAVRFAEPPATETRFRPRTRLEDREDLFYTKADERRFRAEARLETRRMKKERELLSPGPSSSF